MVKWHKSGTIKTCTIPFLFQYWHIPVCRTCTGAPVYMFLWQLRYRQMQFLKRIAWYITRKAPGVFEPTVVLPPTLWVGGYLGLGMAWSFFRHQNCPLHKVLLSGRAFILSLPPCPKASLSQGLPVPRPPCPKASLSQGLPVPRPKAWRFHYPPLAGKGL